MWVKVKGNIKKEKKYTKQKNRMELEEYHLNNSCEIIHHLTIIIISKKILIVKVKCLSSDTLMNFFSFI